MAWLNTATVDKDHKRAEKSRGEIARDRGDTLLVPPCPAPHLVEWLFEAGPVTHGGMGESPLGYRDLQAWQELSGVALMPWEAALMKRLSHSYLAMMQKAEKPDCPAPYTGTRDDVKANRDHVGAKIKTMFGSLKKAEA